MVQIIQRREKSGKDSGDYFAEAIMHMSEAYEKKQLQKQMQEQMMEENEAFKRETGRDISGIRSPELRKTFSESILKGKEPDKKDIAGIKNRTQKSFNRLWELAPDLGRGSGIMSLAGGKTAEKTGEFQSLTGALEAQLKDEVSTGTLSNARFQYITETLLPKPTDTVATIKGKLKGIAEMLELDIPGSEKEKPGLHGPKDSEDELLEEIKRRGLKV